MAKTLTPTVTRGAAGSVRPEDGAPRGKARRPIATEDWLADLSDMLEDAAIVASFTMSPKNWR